MRSNRTAACAATFFMALTAPAVADKGGGHDGDPSPGNSGDHKVVICHHAGPDKTITITVDNEGQLNGHLHHGDTIGPCPDPVPPVTPPVVDPPTTTGPSGPTGVVPPPATSPTGTAPVASVPVPEGQPDPIAPTKLTVAVKQAKAKGNSPEARQVRRERRQAADRALETKLSAAPQAQELPYTGLPAGLVALFGIAGIAGGLALRRKGI